MQDAKARADDLARLANVTLGKPAYISESSSTPYPYPVTAARGAMDAASPSTQISPGEMDIVLNIQVAYSIQ